MKHPSIILLSLALPLCMTSCQKPPKDNVNAPAVQEVTQPQEAQPDTAPIQAVPDAAKPADSADETAPAAIESPAPLDEKAAAPANDFVKTSGDWSDMQIELRSIPISSDDKDKAIIQKEVAELLQKWNNLRNLKGYEKLDKLYFKTAYLRGKALEQKDIASYLKKSFEKHKDFSQTPGIQVTMDYLYTFSTEAIENWSVRFNESFTQDGKTTDTEIFMVLKRVHPDDGQSFWSIYVESDISTDRNMAKKLGLAPSQAPANCAQLAYQILAESPMIRYEINTIYQAAQTDLKAGTLEGINLAEDPSEEPPNDHAKIHSYRLYEDHPGDSEDPESSGYRVTLNNYTVDLEDHKIEDEANEVFHTIEARYAADIKRLCK
ncbi:MAG: hypothetical protein IKY83_03880 [Proteobacteria bacterium]|nr:hypothetical protein [Pseudomonadota bacterium]